MNINIIEDFTYVMGKDLDHSIVDHKYQNIHVDGTTTVDVAT